MWMLFAGILSGCGMVPWLGRDKDPTPPTRLAEIVPSVTVSTLWSVRPTRGTEGRRLYLVPAMTSDRVFIGDSRGRLVAIATDQGRVVWERETGLRFSGGPDVLGDRLVIGTSKGEVIAFSTRDGAEQWRAELGSEVLSVPRLTDAGQVIVHTLDDSIHGLDAANGAVQWRVGYQAPVLTLRGSASPVLTSAGVLVGLSGGRLLNLDPTDGTPLWEVVITRPRGRSELARITDIDADPVVVGNVAFVGSYNGDLSAVDISSGTVLWRRELSAYAGLVADASNLFVTDSLDQVWAADPSDGAGRWRQEGLRYRVVSAPAMLPDLIAVGDFEGYLHLMSKQDGRLVGRTRITNKGAITARPAFSNGRLFVLADDGTLAALSLGALGSPKTVADAAAGAAVSAPELVDDESGDAETGVSAERRVSP